LSSLPSTQLFQLKAQIQIKTISPTTVFFIKIIANVDTNILSWEEIHLIKKKHSDFAKMFSEIDIIEFLADNIFVMLNGHLFPQTVGISMGTKCDLLADLLLYLYKKDFIAQSFNFTFCYIDVVLS
jgi:hypothetical protein